MAVCKSVTIPGMTGHVRRNTQLDYDEQSALFFEMKKACDRVLDGLRLGHSEEIFIRCREGCICIWPVGDMVFACMARPSVNSQRMQMLAWKTVSALGALV
jgi:predicted regulator of Ras-like GTPase activity (Roadblock/LC7/MglB family)